MTDIILLRQFIGLDVNKKVLGIMITHPNYIRDLLKIFHMTNCKATPFSFLYDIRLKKVVPHHWLTVHSINSLLGS